MDHPIPMVLHMLYITKSLTQQLILLSSQFNQVTKFKSTRLQYLTLVSTIYMSKALLPILIAPRLLKHSYLQLILSVEVYTSIHIYLLHMVFIKSVIWQLPSNLMHTLIILAFVVIHSLIVLICRMALLFLAA
jgi:hypothetical protein